MSKKTIKDRQRNNAEILFNEIIATTPKDNSKVQFLHGRVHIDDIERLKKK